MRTLPLLLALSCAAPALAQDATQARRDAPARADHDYAVDVGGVLYKIDCEKLSYVKLGKVAVPPKEGTKGRTDKPVLCDLAATADGYLYGISTTSLYLINLSEPSKSKKLGDHGLPGPYGMAAVGSSLVVNTVGGRVHVLDKKTAESTPLGNMGGSWAASGDIALAGGKLVSSVKDSNGREHLVELSADSGKAKLVGAFKTPDGAAVPNVFGLIDRKGILYGLTSSGDILRIEPDTGRCVILKRTGLSWWGATSYTRI